MKRCIDRPVFHLRSARRGAIFTVCVFPIEVTPWWILKLPPIFAEMECRKNRSVRVRMCGIWWTERVAHPRSCRGAPGLIISASVRGRREKREIRKAVKSLAESLFKGQSCLTLETVYGLHSKHTLPQCFVKTRRGTVSSFRLLCTLDENRICAGQQGLYF